MMLSVVTCLRPSLMAALVIVAGASVQAEEAVAPDPSRAYTHFIKANDYYTNQELDMAVREYKTALLYDPLHADTLCNLGSVLQDLGEFVLSREYYAKAVSANPYHAVAHFNLGLLVHDEDIDTAIEHYQSAVEMDPSMADAWSNLGSAYHHENHLEDALGCYQEAIQLYETEEAYRALPYTEDVLATLNYHTSLVLGRLPDKRCMHGGCEAQRMEVLRRCLRHNPEHALCTHNLESMLGSSKMTKASSEYVKALFDFYATSFDESLKGLDYSSPRELRDVLGKLRPRYREVFDAGCGTGLLGPLFRGISDTLIGVDLSEAMLESAVEKGVYDALAEGDIVELLRMCPDDAGNLMVAIAPNVRVPTLPLHAPALACVDLSMFYFRQRAGQGIKGDLVVAADVFVYIGDLDDVVSAARDYLEEEGVLAFTCELSTPEKCAAAGGCLGWQLLSSGRFAHTKAYLLELAERWGFDVVHYREMVPRTEGGDPVPGQLVVLVRRGGSESGVGVAPRGDMGGVSKGSSEL